MPFWQYTGDISRIYPTFTLTANPGDVFDLGDITEPPDPLYWKAAPKSAKANKRRDNEVQPDGTDPTDTAAEIPAVIPVDGEPATN